LSVRKSRIAVPFVLGVERGPLAVGRKNAKRVKRERDVSLL